MDGGYILSSTNNGEEIDNVVLGKKSIWLKDPMTGVQLSLFCGNRREGEDYVDDLAIEGNVRMLTAKGSLMIPAGAFARLLVEIRRDEEAGKYFKHNISLSLEEMIEKLNLEISVKDLLSRNPDMREIVKVLNNE